MTRVVNDRTQHTVHFWPKKNGQVGGGVQSSSNFSASVAITFKSSQCVLGCTESNVSQKEQTYCYPKSPDDRSNKITCKCIEFLIDSVDVTLVYKDDLQLQRRIKVVLAALSPQKITLTHFFERMGCSDHQKSESAVLQTDLLLLSDLVCRN